MRADSFKDILAKFLEANTETVEQARAATDSIFGSQTADIPFVFLDTAIPVSRAKVAAYGSTRQELKLNSPSRNSEVEGRKHIHRGILPLTGQRALDTLLRLGALDLEAGLSETHLKKAHRRLLKFYHPDHYPLDLSDQERQLRSEQFLELQTAFKTLQIDLTAVAKSSPQS